MQSVFEVLCALACKSLHVLADAVAASVVVEVAVASSGGATALFYSPATHNATAHLE